MHNEWLEGRKCVPEQLTYELTEVDALLGDKVKCQFAAIPGGTRSATTSGDTKDDDAYHWYSASTTSIGNLRCLTLVRHSSSALASSASFCASTWVFSALAFS